MNPVKSNPGDLNVGLWVLNGAGVLIPIQAGVNPLPVSGEIVVSPGPLVTVKALQDGTVDVGYTALMAATDLSAYQSLLFTVVNLSGDKTVTMQVDMSQDGVHLEDRSQADANPILTETCTPGTQCSFLLVPNDRRYFLVGALATGAGTPVKWEVMGVAR